MDGPQLPNETQDVPDAGEATDEAPNGPTTGPHTPARPFLPPRYRRPVAIVGIAAVVVALVGGMLVWRPDSGTDAADSSTPGPSASAHAPDAPIPTVAPGVRLAASAWTPVAELTAEDATAGVVGLATSFRLASLDATPAAELARRLTVVPEIGFSVKPDVDGRSVRITPDEPLAPGAVYRFTLAADDGRTLEFVGIPGASAAPCHRHAAARHGSRCPARHRDRDHVRPGRGRRRGQPRDHRTQGRRPVRAARPSPRVRARASAGPRDPVHHHGHSWRRGRRDGEELESDVRFRFETALAGQAADSTTFQFADDVFESPTSERPVIALWAFQEWDEGEAEPVPPTSAPIEVHRLRDLDAAVDAFRQVRSFPRWTRTSTADLVPTTGLTRVFEFDAELRDSDGRPLVQPARAAARRLVSRDAARRRPDRSRRCSRSPISPATWSSRRRRPSSGRTTSRRAARSPTRSSRPKALISAGPAPMAR